MLDKRMLTFPDPTEFYDPERMTVFFTGRDDEKKVRCAISSEALDDHFADGHGKPLKTFALHRELIEHQARRKYLAEKLENDGSVLVKTEDVGL